MANYRELRINVKDCTEVITDLLAAFLADSGYESFVPDDAGLTAYIKEEEFNDEAVQECLNEFPMPISADYVTKFIEGKDWNHEWEKNYFQPIIIDDKCVVRSSFHTDFPTTPYEIVIDPKMAFGTGHHSTTSLIIRYLLEIDLAGKSVIDMGTGTGILAFLAAMRGASSVNAVEIDPDAYANAVDNSALNNLQEKVEIHLGDVRILSGLEKSDILIANINRNIILADIADYVDALKDNGVMILSGFYEQDIPMVERMAVSLGMTRIDYKEDKNWVALRLTKTK